MGREVKHGVTVFSVKRHRDPEGAVQDEGDGMGMRLRCGREAGTVCPRVVGEIVEVRGREVGVRSLGPQDAVGTRSSNTSERSLLAFYEGPQQ